MPLSSSAYERAFSPTPVGVFEVKQIPPARLVRASGPNGYFESSDILFRPLFRFIRDNDIKMTVPVEAEVNPGSMFFYLGSDVSDRELTGDDEIALVNFPARQVASIGARGGYSEENYKQNLEKLRAWVEANPDWQSIGDARVVFWNGPYTPSFLKRFEVHIPVARSSR